MNKDGLKLTAIMLDAIYKAEAGRDAKKFNLSLWGTSAAKPQECGYSACAVGWAGYFGVVEGLTVDNENFVPEPRFGERTGWSAVEAAYGISYRQAQHLFSRYLYPDPSNVTAKDVANRIRDFVRAN